MGVLDKEFIRQFLTNNPKVEKDENGKEHKTFTPVRYRWTHGATDYHLGDGLLIYSIIQLMRYKTCVCLGSGAGFIPRIMTQARLDLHEQGIFEGDKDYNHGDIGETYLVDAANGVGGKIDYAKKDSFFRYQFVPRFIKDTTENAFYNYFVKKDIKIDFLHIDADEKYQQELIITEDEKEYYELFDGPPKFIKEISSEWKQFNFFNTGIHRSKPASTGLTLLQRA